MIEFRPNPSVSNDAANYAEACVDGIALLKVWRSLSLGAHELVDRDGEPIIDVMLSVERAQRRDALRSAVEFGESLPRPVLGIGWSGGVEIASGADAFVLAVLEGVSEVPVHIRKSALKELRGLIL